MADPASISIVIPAFNESASIAEVVSVLRTAASWREIIVVDDGSSDGTAECAASAGANVVRLPYNMGNGAAVKNGIRRATGEFILIVDADGQHPPEDALRIASRLGEFDLVIGARATATQANQARRAGNGALNRLASYLTGREIPDLTSGFRGARASGLREFLHLLPNGFSYPTTSCLALMKAGHNVTFLPVTARPRVGRSKIRVVRDGVRFVLIILKIVTLYSPLKVFFPISAASFLLGLFYGIWNVYVHGKIPMGSALLIQLAVVVFLFGLISEQIAAGNDRA